MANHKKLKLIYIEWEDAVANTGWFDRSELEEWDKETSLIVKEVGWIYKETKNYLLLVSRMSSYNEKWDKPQYGHIQKIPKTWIRKRKVINHA